MFLRKAAVFAAMLLAPLGVASAQGTTTSGNPVVVELFTSQGCSSCPPADAFLGELATRPDVIALSLHVDYWDYLGWRDPFASPEMTARQRGYAAQRNSRSVFTPQMIIQGETSAVGHQRDDVLSAIAQAAAAPAPATIDLSEQNGRLLVVITPQREGLGGVVHVVSYDLPQRMQITNGENRGQTLTYTNVVTDWMRLGEWNGERVELFAPAPQMGKGVAVIVQDGPVGPVLAAARMER